MSSCRVERETERRCSVAVHECRLPVVIDIQRYCGSFTPWNETCDVLLVTEFHLSIIFAYKTGRYIHMDLYLNFLIQEVYIIRGKEKLSTVSRKTERISCIAIEIEEIAEINRE